MMSMHALEQLCIENMTHLVDNSTDPEVPMKNWETLLENGRKKEKELNGLRPELKKNIQDALSILLKSFEKQEVDNDWISELDNSQSELERLEVSDEMFDIVHSLRETYNKLSIPEPPQNKSMIIKVRIVQRILKDNRFSKTTSLVSVPVQSRKPLSQVRNFLADTYGYARDFSALNIVNSKTNDLLEETQTPSELGIRENDYILIEMKSPYGMPGVFKAFDSTNQSYFTRAEIPSFLESQGFKADDSLCDKVWEFLKCGQSKVSFKHFAHMITPELHTHELTLMLFYILSRSEEETKEFLELAPKYQIRYLMSVSQMLSRRNQRERLRRVQSTYALFGIFDPFFR